MEQITPYIPYIFGIVVMPVLAALKKTKLADWIPYEHQKTILALIVMGIVVNLANVEIDFKTFIDETLKAVGAGTALYGGAKYKRRWSKS